MENLNAEKVEAYRQELAKVRVALSEANYDKKRLTEENDKLHASYTELARVHEKVKRGWESDIILRTQEKEDLIADMVRKMRERIAEHATNGYPRKVRLDVVDQIAKEMVEGEM
jgi:hypothetical protein